MIRGRSCPASSRATAAWLDACSSAGMRSAVMRLSRHSPRPLCSACSAPASDSARGEDDALGTRTSAVIKGTASPCVAGLGRDDPDGRPEGGFCSGTLIAPNVVLTARHCVSTYAEDDCGTFTGDIPPPPQGIAIGAGANEKTAPVAHAKKYFYVDAAKGLCDPAIDIAVILLDRERHRRADRQGAQRAGDGRRDVHRGRLRRGREQAGLHSPAAHGRDVARGRPRHEDVHADERGRVRLRAPARRDRGLGGRVPRRQRRTALRYAAAASWASRREERIRSTCASRDRTSSAPSRSTWTSSIARWLKPATRARTTTTTSPTSDSDATNDDSDTTTADEEEGPGTEEEEEDELARGPTERRLRGLGACGSRQQLRRPRRDRPRPRGSCASTPPLAARVSCRTCPCPCPYFFIARICNTLNAARTPRTAPHHRPSP